MKLIFIYGPSAVGKTTVGGQLAQLTGYRFFFNHLTVPAAMAIFPGHKDRSRDEEYWQLLRRLRLDCIQTAAKVGLNTIFTLAYQGAIDDESVDEIVDVVTSHGGTIHFVQLSAPEDILMERVGNKSRSDLRLGKITDPAYLKEALTPGMYESVKYSGVLKLDTTDLQPEAAAKRIVSYFGLNREAGS